MKLFDNIKCQIYYENGASIRNDKYWLLDFSYEGMQLSSSINQYDVDSRGRLQIIGVDEL